MTVAILSGITHERKESLQSYIDRFMQVVVKVERVEEGLKCWILKNALLRDNPFWKKLG